MKELKQDVIDIKNPAIFLHDLGNEFFINNTLCTILYFCKHNI